MNAFETTAFLEDASHLTLCEPVPSLPASVRECRVIVLFETEVEKPTVWPTNFFDEIRVTDPAFARPVQGDVPSIPALEPASEGPA